MSGHFVVWDIKRQDSDALRGAFTTLSHDIVNADPHVWTPHTQQTLMTAMGGGAINREDMPSHGYYHINHPSQTACDTARDGGTLDSLALRLVRPNIGLKTLAPDAAIAWGEGRKLDALLAQARHSTATIEYYYAAGMHV